MRVDPKLKYSCHEVLIILNNYSKNYPNPPFAVRFYKFYADYHLKNGLLFSLSRYVEVIRDSTVFLFNDVKPIQAFMDFVNERMLFGLEGEFRFKGLVVYDRLLSKEQIPEPMSVWFDPNLVLNLDKYDYAFCGLARGGLPVSFVNGLSIPCFMT